MLIRRAKPSTAERLRAKVARGAGVMSFSSSGMYVVSSSGESRGDVSDGAMVGGWSRCRNLLNYVCLPHSFASVDVVQALNGRCTMYPGRDDNEVRSHRVQLRQTYR